MEIFTSFEKIFIKDRLKNGLDRFFEHVGIKDIKSRKEIVIIFEEINMKYYNRKVQGPPEIAPEPSPAITPEMLRDVLNLLESKGMVHYAAGGAYIPTESGWKLLMEITPTKEEIIAYGHPEIKATSNSMIKFVKGLVVKDESTIGIKADKACKDLSEEFKIAARSARRIEILLEAEGEQDKIVGYCSPALKLTNKEEIVIRKDSSIDSGTITILADKAASELNQNLIEKLKNSNTRIKITLEIKS